MQVVVFDGCMGWLHPASGPHGVVLCNAFGYDELCTHRAWFQFAQWLAGQGISVLRFDYPGTGDSLGVEEEPARIDRWIGSIGTALDYLRTACGVQRISLCGFRLGATLAALAAQRSGGVDGLALLAPVLSGRRYVRELHAHRQCWLSTCPGLDATPQAGGAPVAEAFGFGLHGDDVGQLSDIDLRTDTSAPARRVLLLDANDRSGGDALIATYRLNGVAVQRHSFDELASFLVEARFSKMPTHAFATVSTWLGAHARVGASSAARDDDRNPLCVPRTPNPLAMAVAPELTGMHFVEQPVLFGGYFGVYCRPLISSANAPALLFPNTAASHHIGDARYFVLFARRLASSGIASLRMDLRGLGDSAEIEQPVTLESLHSERACADVTAGADWLVAHGHAAVITFGICSGAFVGLRACAEHPQIVGSFGVNTQRFMWESEERARSDGALSSTPILRRSALSPEKWKRALTGKTSLAHVVHGLSKRMGRRFVRRLSDLLDAMLGWSFAPNHSRLLLERLHEKGAEVRLLYGEFDQGVDELKLQFGSKLQGLRKFSRVRVTILPMLDHALFTRAAREAAMSDAEQWLRERFPMVSHAGQKATSVQPPTLTAAPSTDP